MPGVATRRRSSAAGSLQMQHQLTIGTTFRLTIGTTFRCRRSGGVWSMQPGRGPDITKPRSCGGPRLTDPDRVKLAFEIAAPEFQKAAQLGKVRGNVELLPDEALQQVGMI